MAKSLPDPNSRLCIWIEDGEVKCYANRPALLYLAKEIRRIADAKSDDYYEVHLKSELFSLAKSGSGAIPNVWVVDKRKPAQSTHLALTDFEVTIMHVGESELDKLRKSQHSRDARD
ncbi:hypothetical protein [Hyphomicrobium methylovorum]|uniref:hypothetical protein n=1 Tax=Hyphomicrobium methylovorum TaxID=84 RepID=UPI0015E79380|nr:hypothetical protein [Hyphomicrobium methylovorum]